MRPEAVGRLHLGNAVDLPFPDNSFKAAISSHHPHLERQMPPRPQGDARLAPAAASSRSIPTARRARALFVDWVLTATPLPRLSRRLACPLAEAGYTATIIDDHRSEPLDRRRIFAATHFDPTSARALRRYDGGFSISSQQVSRCISAPAYSCTEIVDAIYHDLLRGRRRLRRRYLLLSKVHGCMIQ